MKNMININDKSKSNERSIVGNRLTIISLLIIILLISVVYAAETTSSSTGSTDTSAQTSTSSTINIGLENNLDPNKLASLTEVQKRNAENAKYYAQNNWEKVDGSYGNFKIDENGRMIITKANGDSFADIPKGYDILKDTKKFTAKNNGAASDSTLEIQGNKFKTGKDAEVSYSETDGKQNIELKGKGDVQFGEKKIEGIQDGKFVVDKDKEIISATFTSIDGGKYEFETKSGKYTFNTQKGGEVSYNKETGEIAGKNLELTLPDGSKLSTKGFSGKYDKNGNLMSLSTEGLSKYTDKNGKIYFADDLKIYKDGTNPANVNGNAIFFQGDNQAITLKGIVQANNGKGLNYNGYSENTFTKYNPNTNNFDVKGGDARISNGENTITYKNGQASIGREGLTSSKDAQSFTTRYQDEEGKIITTTIDKTSDTLSLSTVQNGKVTATAIVPLSDYEGSLNNPGVVQDLHISQLENNLQQLKSSSASQDKIDALELAIANAQNRNDYIGNSIDRIKTYLDGDRSPDSELNAKLALAELYAKRAANPEVPIGTSLLEWEKTSRLQSARDYRASIDTYKTIKESSQAAKEIQEAAGFGLAEVYRKSGDPIPALQVYNDLINHGSSEETISNAELGIAQIHLENNDPRKSLISLDNALSTNPSNIQALQLKEGIIDGVYENIKKGLGNQLTEFVKAYEEKLGLGSYKSLLETPGAALKAAFLNTGTVVWNSMGKTDGGISAVFMGKQYDISQAQLGTSVFESIMREGYSDTEFAQLNFNDRKKVIADSYGLGYIDENKLKQAFLESNKDILVRPESYLDEQGYLDRYNSERDNFIKKLYGEEGLRQDKLIYDMATASMNAQKDIYDLDLITDPKKLADSSNPDFKFKTGEGYIDPENLKLTWKDSVLSQINLVNAAATLAPGATLTIAGRTMTVAGWMGTGARAIPGVEAGIEGINTARIGAAEALGLKAVAEAMPKTAAAGGFVSRELANFQVGNIIMETVPGGQYIAPFVNINPSTDGLRAAGEIADDIAASGAKITLKDFVRVEAGNAQWAPRYFATAEDMNTILSNAKRLGLTEVTDLGESLNPGIKLFMNQEGKQFSIFPEGYAPSFQSPSINFMSRPSTHNEMLDLRYGGATPGQLAEAGSYNLAAQQAGVSELVIRKSSEHNNFDEVFQKLSVDEVNKIANEYGVVLRGSEGEALLGSSLGRPNTKVFGQEPYGTFPEKSAALFESIVLNHAYTDANKRIAVDVVMKAASDSGIHIKSSKSQLMDLANNVASGKIRGVENIKSYF